MNPAVLKRFIIYLAIATFAMFSVWTIRQVWIDRPPGDYYVEEGGLRLQDELYDQALVAFNNALNEQPDHRGALMGRAIAFMQSDRPAEAEAEFTYLIKYLEANVQDDDLTGVGALAAAYGNRGILHDRMGRYEQALADYKRALRIDFSSVEGPGIVDRILYSVQPATIEKRAHYIQDQLKLPPEQRVLKNAEIDAKQRMHKP